MNNNNILPNEILEMIAINLSLKNQFNCLTICKSWYLPFCTILYRHIIISNRYQLKKFLNNLNIYGQWIRTIQIGLLKWNNLFKLEDCVTGAIPLLSIQVGVTLHELIKLIQNLPLLQSINFDHRLWNFMNTTKLNFSNKIFSLPPLNHPKQFNLLNGQIIQKLHLKGVDIFQLHQNELFLINLKNLPLLNELIIDNDNIWDTTKDRMHFTINDMNQLHQYLPKLKKLFITDAIHFITTATNNIIVYPQIKLKEFHLVASIDCLDTWFHYFSLTYPLLTQLTINITCHQYNQQQKTALLAHQWIKKLNYLKVLDIHPNMTKDFMDERIINSIPSTLETLNISLWGNDIETSLNALQSIKKSNFVSNIKNLVIPIWISNGMNLSAFTSLFQLELTCLQRNSQEYSIDIILDNCLVLNHLELNWGQVTIINNHSHYYYKKYNHPLKTLRMNHVLICNSNVFSYISMICSTIEGLFLRRCTGVTELNMLDSHFKYIVLSEVLLETIVVSYLKLTQTDRNKKQLNRCYKTYQDQNTFQTCIQRLKIEQKEDFIIIKCASVEQLIFNGCRL